MDRCGLITVQAAREAWEASGAEVEDPTRAASSSAPASAASRCSRPARASSRPRGPDRISPHLIGAMLVDTPTSYVATDLGIRGPNFAVVSACATGAHAIGEAAEMVRRGDADLILAGGAEACITELILGGFCNMRALGSPRDPDDPASASRPFDATRDGFIVGEGAAVVVLEREDDARARGAPIVAELVGYGASNDAFHIAAPASRGRRRGGDDARRRSRAPACAPEEVGYVNAHGTSTPLNDAAETAAIRTVFGAHADQLAVSSTKSMTGHLFGAAGALETAVCALALRDGIVPPTINLQRARPRVRPRLRAARAPAGCPTCSYAISNSMGLGGHNGCTLLARV